jgi:hypothetical protein
VFEEGESACGYDAWFLRGFRLRTLAAKYTGDEMKDLVRGYMSLCPWYMSVVPHAEKWRTFSALGKVAIDVMER